MYLMYLCFDNMEQSGAQQLVSRLSKDKLGTFLNSHLSPNKHVKDGLRESFHVIADGVSCRIWMSQRQLKHWDPRVTWSAQAHDQTGAEHLRNGATQASVRACVRAYVCGALKSVWMQIRKREGEEDHCTTVKGHTQTTLWQGGRQSEGGEGGRCQGK